MGKRENILRAQAGQSVSLASDSAVRSGAIQDVGQLARQDFLGQSLLPSSSDLSNLRETEQDFAGGLRERLFEQTDFDSISDRWRTSFAEPAMQAWWDFNAPQIRDEFAGIGGGFYSSDRGRRVANQASQFMATSITPTLFGAQENAAARIPGIVGMLQGMGPAGVESNLLSLSQQAGQAGMNPYLSMLLGIQPQQVNAAPVGQESGNKAGALIGGIAGIGAQMAFGPMAPAGLGQLGSMIGGLFG